MGVINDITQFEDYLASEEFKKSAFARLSNNDLYFFKTQLSFSEDGIPAGYWGDLVRNEFMRESDLGKLVSDVFGVDGETFLKCLHKFGDGQGNCTPRLYWNCPHC